MYRIYRLNKLSLSFSYRKLNVISRYFSSQYKFGRKNNFDEEYKKLKKSFTSKIIFNSFFKYENFILRKQKEFDEILNEQRKKLKSKPVPIFLKYITDGDDKLLHNTFSEQNGSEDVNKCVVLPFSVSKVNVPVYHQEGIKENVDEDNKEELENKNSVIFENIVDKNVQNMSSGKWMRDYDYYEEMEEEIDSDNSLTTYNVNKKYGKPNQNIPISKVPCGGCGALLHCQDPGIPGYLPSEIFASYNSKELGGITCQRCHFMKNYNTALSVSVDPNSYPELLSKIKNENALVLLMIDITDFPCSFWPNIINVVGLKKPIFIIANKIDLIYGDRKGWLPRAKKAIKDILPKHANIVNISFVSAKTGFGIEDLINKLYNFWEYKGDVYLVGCTNVGKSTLFNALLASDYCKTQAIDLLQRATTSPWPGTTLNLLKFPILRPSGVRLFLRTQRLMKDNMMLTKETMLKKMQLGKGDDVDEPVQLIGHIGRSFSKTSDKLEMSDPFRSSKSVTLNKLPQSGIDTNNKDYKHSRWMYDTPGVIHADQIIDLLTTEELLKTIPKDPIEHQVFIFKKNWTLFIAGLARLDLIELSECKDSLIKVAIFRPNTLPITICETDVADELYKEFVGTEMLTVPYGGPERMKVWPSLKPCNDIVLQGKSFHESCADIVLSNAGWIAITANKGIICKFRCWTPDARGIHVRKIPLLKYATTVHGQRIHKTPVYNKKYVKEASIITNW